MRTPVRQEQADFRGGLNLAADEDQLEDNEVRSAANARLTTYGAFKKRYGSQRIHATAVGGGVLNMQGGYAYRQSSGAILELLVYGGGLYSGTYGIPMTWTLVAASGTLNNAATPSFAQFRDASAECVYIANAGGTTQQLCKYKAGVLTMNLASTPTVLNRLAVQNQRLFGITGYDQTLWYSELNNGDTLGIEAQGGGFQVVRTFGDQNITALAAVGSSLLMFHKTGISKFTGYGQGDITIASGTRGLASDTGTIAPDSIVVVENVCYFLTDRGWYMATEESVKMISAKLNGLDSQLSSSVPPPVAAQASASQVRVAHSRSTQEVLWYIAAGGGGIYVYNYRLDAWTGPLNGLYGFSGLAAMWETLDSSNRPIVLFGKPDGFVRLVDATGPSGTGLFKDDILSDGTGGSAFTLTVRVRRMYFGNPASEKAFRYVYVQGDLDSSAGATVKLESDIVTGTTTALGIYANDRTQRVQGSGRGQYADVTIADNGTTAAPSFSRVIVEGVEYAQRF